MRRLALRSVLSAKVRDGEVKILDKLAIEEPKTKLIAEMLDIDGHCKHSDHRRGYQQ